MNDYKSLAEVLRGLLGLERKIVGIRFLFNSEDYAADPTPEVKSKMSYCNMVRLATKGHSFKASLPQFLCYGSAKALGLALPDENALSGRTYFSMGLYEDLNRSKEVQRQVSYMDPGTYGVVVKPLESFKGTPPDTVLIISKPYQTMRLAQGYGFHHGYPKNIQFIGNAGICAECTASPYLHKDMNVSMLCSNTRFSAKWTDEEMGVGMDFLTFLRVIDGLKSTFGPCETSDRKSEVEKRMASNGISANLRFTENPAYFEKK